MFQRVRTYFLVNQANGTKVEAYESREGREELEEIATMGTLSKYRAAFHREALLSEGKQC